MCKLKPCLRAGVLAVMLLASGAGGTAVSAVNALTLSGGSTMSNTGLLVSYTNDYAAAASVLKDGVRYPSVLLGEGGVLGSGRVLAFANAGFASGGGMDATLKTELFTNWAFRGKASPKVVVDLDCCSTDVKAHLQAMGATIAAEGLSGYSSIANLKTTLEADNIDTLVLTFPENRHAGNPPYSTDGYESAIIDWIKAGGSVIAAGATTPWTWNYNDGRYRQNTCRLYPGNKIFESVGLLWYCRGYSFSYDSEWTKIVTEPDLVLSKALGDLAAHTSTSVLSATLPASQTLQLDTLLICSPCSGTANVCTDLAVYDDIWTKGNNVVSGPCEPTYNGLHSNLTFPIPNDNGWATCTSTLKSIFAGFPDSKQPSAAVLNAAKRFPLSGYTLDVANRQAVVTQEIKPYLKGWHSTGCYAAPGDQIEIQIPSKYIGGITVMRIGVHSDGLWPRDEWLRFPETLVKQRDFDSTGNARMVSVWGGPVWVWVDWSIPSTENATYLSRTNDVILTIKNVYRMLWYEHGVTTEADWEIQRARPDAPWADLQCRTETYSIPHKSVDVDWDELYRVCEHYWDRAVGLGENEMTGAGGYWDQRSEIAVFDVQISIGWMHSGYPWMGHLKGSLSIPKDVYWDEASNAFANLYNGNWGDFHEMGHNHDGQAWTYKVGEVHTNTWVCMAYHQTPQYPADRCIGHEKGMLMDRHGFFAETGGPCTYYYSETETWWGSGVTQNGCGPFPSLNKHVAIMTQLGFAVYKKHIRRGNHLKKNAGDGAYWYDEQSGRKNYALSFQVHRDTRALWWGYSILPDVKTEYRIAVLMDDPLTYIRFDTPSDAAVDSMLSAADATRTRPVRLGPGSTQTTFTTTALVGQTAPTNSRVAGKSATFDGSQTVVAALANERACDGAGAVELWLKLDSVSAAGLVQKQLASGGTALWRVAVTAGGKAALQIFDNAGAQAAEVDAGSAGLTTGAWTHIAVTWAAHGVVPSATDYSVVVYVNGVRYGPQALDVLPAASADFEYKMGEGLTGALAEVAVYCSPLTPDQVGLHYHGLGYFTPWTPLDFRPYTWRDESCAEDPVKYAACHHAVSVMPGQAGVCEYCARRTCPGVPDRSAQITCLNICDEPTATESHAGGCTPDMCLNGGTCAPEAARVGLPSGAYSCSCTSGFAGFNCEIAVPTPTTGTPTSSSVHAQSANAPFEWFLKAGVDILGDGFKCEHDLSDCPDYLSGESGVRPTLGSTKSFLWNGHSYSWEWQKLQTNSTNNYKFPDGRSETLAQRDKMVYYHSLALFTSTAQPAAVFQYETSEGMRVWINGKKCIHTDWSKSNSEICALELGWNQVVVKAREDFKLTPSAGIDWSLQVPANAITEERFFRVPYEHKRSVYPVWWTSSAVSKAVGLRVEFDYPRNTQFGNGEMLRPRGKIVSQGQCGGSKNGLGGDADGFVLADEYSFTTTAGITDPSTSFDVCFWHPVCEQWRKVGATLEIATTTSPCGAPPTCWTDLGDCKWEKVADGTACSAGICMQGVCADVTVAAITCTGGAPDCRIRKELSVATVSTGGALVQDIDHRFEPWGASALPHTPAPIFSSLGDGGIMVAWTVNDPTYTRSNTMGKVGKKTIRVSFLDLNMQRRPGKPDIHILDGTVQGFAASASGRFALLRWSPPRLFVERYHPNGTRLWSTLLTSDAKSFHVGDSRMVAGADFYAVYYHLGKEGDHYAEVDMFGLVNWGAEVTDWCKPGYRHELGVHKALGEVMTVCVGAGIRVRTHRISTIDVVVHDIPVKEGWGRAAGDISPPVAVEDGFWFAISAAKTATTTFQKSDKLQLGLVHVKWVGGTWQVQPIVWPTAGTVDEVAPRLWELGAAREYLLVGWQRDIQGPGHQSSMPSEQQYYLSIFNPDPSRGEVGFLKDTSGTEVIEEVTDAAVWTVHAPGLLTWPNGSAGWVYSWKPGAAEKYKYTNGAGCEFGGNDVCDGIAPPVRGEARITPSQPGEPYLQLVSMQMPDFTCTPTEMQSCQNQTSCQNVFGRITCQCPSGYANKPGVPVAQWGYVDQCEDKSCGSFPTNCGTNATCRNRFHSTTPYTCECPPSHPLGDPSSGGHCHGISRGAQCSTFAGAPLRWGPLRNLLHFGDVTTNIAHGITKTDHFATDDGTLEPRLGEAGPGGALWTPLERADGQWGTLVSSNWYTTAFSLALYSPVVQKIWLNVSHDIAFKVRFGRGWAFNAPVLYENGTKNDKAIELDFTAPGWWWILIKFYDDYNYRNLQLSTTPQAAVEWPTMGWCYDLPAVDECRDNIHNCAASALCANTAKHFTCECPIGKAGDPPSGYNGDPTVGCVAVEGEPLGKGYLTKLLHYGGESYNIGGSITQEKFAKPKAAMTPVTGDSGPGAGEVWTRVERADGNLPYSGNWHTDAFSFVLWSGTEQTVQVKVETAADNNAKAQVYLEGQLVFDGSATATVPFALKKGWSQVFVYYYVDYNYRLLRFEFPWNTLGWWYEKPLVDECKNSTLNSCHAKSNCIDTASGYECQCLIGYAGDGKTECLAIEGESLGDGLVKKALRYFDKNDNATYIAGGISSTHFDACCGGDAQLRPRIEEHSGAKGVDWWWGKWQAPEYNGVAGNLVTVGQPSWYTDIFSWAVYSPKDQQVDLIVYAQCCNSRVWLNNALVNEVAFKTEPNVTKVTLTRGWHQLVGKFYANYNSRTFTVKFNASNLGWGYEVPLINECQLPSRGNCHADAICVDTPKSYYCECKNGYSGDGTISCVQAEGQGLGCGKITKLLKYGDEAFNHGGGIDADKFSSAGLGLESAQQPATGDAGFDASQVWTRVERADGNLPYAGNWRTDLFALAVYSPADNTQVTISTDCLGSNSKCRLWSDGAVVYSGAEGDRNVEVTVTLPKGWHQWVAKYYVNYNARTYHLDIKSPCTLGWAYEIPGPNEKCLATVCRSQGQCREVGQCTDNSTGACSNPAKTDGTACDDGNPNTAQDACSAGVCTGTDLCAGVTCAAPQACREPGVCVAATGTCVYQTMLDGASCDDGQATTVDDKCTSGTCSGVDRCTGVTCVAASTCHDVGVCDHNTGFCTSPVQTDGSLCDDSLANTADDQCTSGVCRGVNKCLGVHCVPPQCHGAAGGCDVQTGLCVFPVLANGTACDDGDVATIGDTCRNGWCSGTPADGAMCPSYPTCNVPGQCQDAPTCGGATGMVCIYNNKPNGFPCDDGNALTTDDRCYQGQCLAHGLCTNVVCGNPASQCMEQAVCNPATGQCTSLPRANGTGCDDGDPTTADDQCRGGQCSGTNLCTSPCTVNVCQTASCYPATGVCTYTAVADQTACTTPQGLEGGCVSGACQQTNPCDGVTCTAQDSCHNVGTCNPATGICSNIQRSDGASCQGSGTCSSGVCVGAAPSAAPTAPPRPNPTSSPTKAPLPQGSPTQAPVTNPPSSTPTHSPSHETSSPSGGPSKSPLPPGTPTQPPVTSPPTSSPSKPPSKSPLAPGSPTQSPIASPPTQSPSKSPSK
eukprot:Hpha_TRINITY_DN15409_c0_g2::TRINITY_DN15409_c0_g2_i7::g.176040::m.176040